MGFDVGLSEESNEIQAFILSVFDSIVESEIVAHYIYPKSVFTCHVKD